VPKTTNLHLFIIICGEGKRNINTSKIGWVGRGGFTWEKSRVQISRTTQSSWKIRENVIKWSWLVLVGGSPLIIILIFVGFHFCFVDCFFLSSVFWHSTKMHLPTIFYWALFAECNTRQSLNRVQNGLCWVSKALGKDDSSCDTRPIARISGHKGSLVASNPLWSSFKVQKLDCESPFPTSLLVSTMSLVSRGGSKIRSRSGSVY
jgi:hypothetical protein